MHEQKESAKPHSEYVQRKSLCQLVYKKLEDIGTITFKQYQKVLKKYPLLSENQKCYSANFFTLNPNKCGKNLFTVYKISFKLVHFFTPP